MKNVSAFMCHKALCDDSFILCFAKSMHYCIIFRHQNASGPIAFFAFFILAVSAEEQKNCTLAFRYLKMMVYFNLHLLVYSVESKNTYAKFWL